MRYASSAVLISRGRRRQKRRVCPYLLFLLWVRASINARSNLKSPRQPLRSCSSGCYSLLDSSRRPPTLIPNQHTPGAFSPSLDTKKNSTSEHSTNIYALFWSQCGLPLPYLLSPTTTAAPRPSINCRKRAHLRSALVSSAATVLCRRSTSICSLCSRSVWRKRARSVSTSALCLLVSRHEMKKAQGNKKKHDDDDTPELNGDIGTPREA